MRVLIADDEAALRDWLVRLLAQEAPDWQIVAQAADGLQALEALARLQPDLAFLDIRMPGLNGLEVGVRARHLAPGCRRVFVTAYDEFAVQAFEQAAVDYLLKPVTPERLRLTLDRLGASANPVAAPTDALLAQLLTRLTPPSRPDYLRWLRVGQDGPDGGTGVELVAVAQVDVFQAADKYTLARQCAGEAHAGAREWLLRTSLRELEAQLDPDAFWRVHRSTLVRVAAIARVRRDLMGRWWLDVHGSAAPVAVSQAYAHLFRRM